MRRRIAPETANVCVPAHHGHDLTRGHVEIVERRAAARLLEREHVILRLDAGGGRGVVGLVGEEVDALAVAGPGEVRRRAAQLGQHAHLAADGSKMDLRVLSVDRPGRECQRLAVRGPGDFALELARALGDARSRHPPGPRRRLVPRPVPRAGLVDDHAAVPGRQRAGGARQLDQIDRVHRARRRSLGGCRECGNQGQQADRQAVRSHALLFPSVVRARHRPRETARA
jgi:hypothetical protein